MLILSSLVLDAVAGLCFHRQAAHTTLPRRINEGTGTQYAQHWGFFLKIWIQ